jgi:hypothetical protein
MGLFRGFDLSWFRDKNSFSFILSGSRFLVSYFYGFDIQLPAGYNV